MVEYTRIQLTESLSPSSSPERIASDSRMQDWRQAIQIPTAYRIGNSTVRLQYQFVFGVVAVGILVLVLFYNSFQSRALRDSPGFMLEKRFPPILSDSNSIHTEKNHLPEIKGPAYNSTYPLTNPIRTEKGVRYRIAIIADLDTNSKKGEEEWISYLKTGSMYFDSDKDKVRISFKPLSFISVQLKCFSFSVVR